MNLETKITIYKFTPQLFTLTLNLLLLVDLLLIYSCCLAQRKFLVGKF